MIIMRMLTVKEKSILNQKMRRRRRMKTWPMTNWIEWSRDLFLF